MVFRYFGHVDWVLSPLEKLLLYEMDFEIYEFSKWLRNMLIGVLFKFRHRLSNQRSSMWLIKLWKVSS